MTLFVSMKIISPLILALLIATFAMAAIAAPPENNEIAVYFGTYTGPKSKGIYLSRLDLASGKLSAPTLAAETEQPSFLALHPNRQFLYAVNETGSGRRGTGQVTAFAVGADGKLTRLNQQPSRGSAPCHLVVDRAGKTLLLANYGGGSVAAFPIGPDGRLGESTAFVQHSGSSTNPQRQKDRMRIPSISTQPITLPSRQILVWTRCWFIDLTRRRARSRRTSHRQLRSRLAAVHAISLSIRTGATLMSLMKSLRQ